MAESDSPSSVAGPTGASEGPSASRPAPAGEASETVEGQRLAAEAGGEAHWKRWGPYLPERQWATVREDYSEWGTCWEDFPHDHARSRAYRWGEDGLLGFCDRQGRLCLGLGLWNGKDPILKERLFGLTGNEGNHGEDAKEEWFYLDSTPTHSYCKALYKYPLTEFPYAHLVDENRRRSREQPEYELADTGVFGGTGYVDAVVEYAKAGPNDILWRITLTLQGPQAAVLHVIPQIWFRNTWAWRKPDDAIVAQPQIRTRADGTLRIEHESLGDFDFELGNDPEGKRPVLLYTDNETNHRRLYGKLNDYPFVKDAFHERIIGGRTEVLRPDGRGTKAGLWYRLELKPGRSVSLRFRLRSRVLPPPQSAATNAGSAPVAEPAPATPEPSPLDPAAFDAVVAARLREADEFYQAHLPSALTDEERNIARQGYAGLLWSKQFYHYVVEDWLNGDPGFRPPPASRQNGRNTEWRHVYARDVISMPDKWEYPWFAAWDLAFHTVSFARIDPTFAKQQLGLLLREWYMHPNGQLPAYEFAFGDVNPPVHAWAAWRVYKMTGPRGERDRDFLESVFQKLLLNFTWWVNRKDATGKNIFSGGFLGLDNIGVFDRSRPLPLGGTLQQADGTAWMAFYAATMLAMALELASDGDRVRTAYEDMASKFLEHFVQIADAMNLLGGTGLWDEADGFYYDQIDLGEGRLPLRTRSLVGLLPLIAVEVLEEAEVERLPGFKKRLDWFVRHRRDLARGVALGRSGSRQRLLLAIPTRDRLRRVLEYLADEEEFLSPFGIRSLSKHHASHPFLLDLGGQEHRVDYSPGESTSGLFGGNSNWRGPVWFPVNYLLVEALERYHHFYGPEFTVEYPARSGRRCTLREIAANLEERLVSLFKPGPDGQRPCHGSERRFANDDAWKHLVLFHEYFHADTGRGLGASHQTGWTALAVQHLENIARRRES